MLKEAHLIESEVKEENQHCLTYCPTIEMTAIFLTRPLQGKLFVKFRKAIMHLPD